MTTKHTPATPLPWEVSDITGDIINSEVPADVTSNLCMNDENVAFAIHAANAYPKLVEALQTILRGEGAFGLDPIQHATNVIEEHKSIAGTLLRSLGEL